MDTPDAIAKYGLMNGERLRAVFLKLLKQNAPAISITIKAKSAVVLASYVLS